METFCGEDVDFGEMRARGPVVSGVFPPLLNNRAFIDKVILGVDGTRRKRISKDLGDIVNRAIGGPGRPYACSKRAIYLPTGNPFELKYGASRRYPNLFDNKLILRSEAVPLAHSDTSEILDCLFRKRRRVAVLGVEFTSDLSIPVRFFENHMLTRARTTRSMVKSLTLNVVGPADQLEDRDTGSHSKMARSPFLARRSPLLFLRASCWPPP